MSGHFPVAIDNGTGWTRAGLATNPEPTVVIRTVTGRHPTENDILSQYQPTTLTVRNNAIFAGEELTSHAGHLIRTYPVSRGAVTEWSHMEALWKHIFKRLGLTASEQPVIVTEPPLNPKYNREKITEVFFEKFQVPKFHITLDTPLALHGVGKTSGLIVNVGEGVTSVAAVYEGFTSSRSILRQDYAGRDITSYLGHLLMEKGHNFLSTSSGIEILRNIKETTAYVAEDPLSEDDNMINTVPYKLPDGTLLEVGNERFLCAESLFHPQLTGLERTSIQSLIFDAVQQSEVDCRRELYRNIFLTGGTPKLPGLSKVRSTFDQLANLHSDTLRDLAPFLCMERSNRIPMEIFRLATRFESRVRLEMEKLAPDGAKLNVYSPSNKQTAVWCGAANLASMSSFDDYWITREEYQEHGTSIVHRKCWSCT